MLLRLPPRRCELSRESPFGSGVRRRHKSFQARVWIGASAGGSLNLGLYANAPAARGVVVDVLRHVPAGAWTPIEVWRTAVSRADRFEGEIGEVLHGLLPKWVYRSSFDKKLVVKVRGRGKVYIRRGFTDPEAAHREGLKLWEKIFGKLQKPSWMVESSNRLPG